MKRFNLLFVLLLLLSFTAESQVVRQSYPDGSKYVGTMKDDMFDGKGTLTFSDGKKYVGTFKDGLYDGKGTITYPDGDKYTGEWKNGMLNGQATCLYSNKDKYVGHFVDGEKDGHGTYFFHNKDKYVGQFKAGKYNGQGTYTFKNKSKYEGEWKDDLQHGFGTFTYSNKDKYTGEWYEDKRNGHGVMVYKNKDKYDGNWEDDEINGYGTYTYSNKNKYEGEWLAGKKNGKGTFTYANKNKYEGEWRDDLKNGQGTLFYANKDVYVGEWENDEMNGSGTLTYANGKEYVGRFKDGKFNGRGTLTFPNGKTQTGKWENGNFKGKAKLPVVKGLYRNDLSDLWDYLSDSGIECSNLNYVPYWNWNCYSYEYELSNVEEQGLTQFEKNLLERYEKVIIEKHTPKFYYVVDNENNIGIYNIDGTIFCPPVPGRMIIVGGGFSFMLVGDCTNEDEFQSQIVSFTYGKGIPAGGCVGVIDHKKGDWIIPYGDYVDIMIVRKSLNTHFYVSKLNENGEPKWGVLDFKGKVVVPCEYRSVGLSGDGYFLNVATGKYTGSNDFDMSERIANREANLRLYERRRAIIATYAYAVGSTLQSIASFDSSSGTSDSNNDESQISNSINSEEVSSGNGNINTTAYNQDRRTYSKCETLLINMSSNSSYSYSDSERISTQQQMRSIRAKWESRGLSITRSSWEDWGGR